METIRPAGHVYEAELTVFTRDGVAKAGPVRAESGQVAVPSWTMDSATGRFGEARIDVFTPVPRDATAWPELP